MPQSVLIVDDHESFRRVARRLLTAEGYAVVGEAADAASALAAVASLEPELVLLDIQLPDQDGFRVAAELAARPAAPGVVLISSRRAADYGDRLRNAAALGFLAKQELSGPALRNLVEPA
jgi:DNA-binding NarL/FixJ family response regulator